YRLSIWAVANSFSNTVSALLSNGDGTAFSVLLLRRYPQDAPVVHDPSTHHGEHRRDRADVVCGHGEVVVAQNDQVGVLAGLERAKAPLLSKIPGAVDGLCAQRLHPRQSLFGGNAGHVGIERPAADDVPEVDERGVRRDVHRVRGKAQMDPTPEDAPEARGAAAGGGECPRRARGHPDAERLGAREGPISGADAVLPGMRDRPVEPRDGVDVVRLLPSVE